MIQPFFNKSHILNCRGKLFDLSEPKIMAIINITPDSFYNKSRFTNNNDITTQVNNIIENGGEIIDVGAYSSRPGANFIDENEEWNRLEPTLELIRKINSDIIISVDTFRSEIAKKSVKEFEVDIINDISAGNLDSNMFNTIAELNVPYIIMHMQGTPQNMQDNPTYKNILQDIFLFFAKKIEQLNQLGVSDIIIDPGFGFGKTIEHNYELLSRLDEFRILELPLLVGLSRKSMICNTLDITPEEALNGTSVLNTLALKSGANILRVHDVKEAVELKKLFKKTYN